MSAVEDTGWDGGWDEARDSGDVGELMLGPYQRYCGDGAAPASRWGSRHSIRSHRYSGDVDNMSALDGTSGVADGIGSDTRRLRVEPGSVPSGAPDNDSLLALLRDVVVDDLATRHDVPVRFMYDVLFGAGDIRLAAGLDADHVEALRAEYQHDFAVAARWWDIDLPQRRAVDHNTDTTAVVCHACDSAVRDGRCRCT